MIVAAAERTPDADVKLRPYTCQQYNARLGKLCTAVVIDAYAPAGAVVRRKCGVCGNWNIIRVEPPDPPPTP